jgi:hypothetical protein
MGVKRGGKEMGEGTYVYTSVMFVVKISYSSNFWDAELIRIVLLGRELYIRRMESGWVCWDR